MRRVASLTASRAGAATAFASTSRCFAAVRSSLASWWSRSAARRWRPLRCWRSVVVAHTRSCAALDLGGGLVDRRSVWVEASLGDGELSFGVGELRSEVTELGSGLRMQRASTAASSSVMLGAKRRQPVRHLAARCRRRGLAIGGGEFSALGGGGDVGAVEGDDAVEDVAGFVEVVAVGDDEDGVVVAAAGERRRRRLGGWWRRRRVRCRWWWCRPGRRVRSRRSRAGRGRGRSRRGARRCRVRVVRSRSAIRRRPMSVTVQSSRLRTGSPSAGGDAAGRCVG